MRRIGNFALAWREAYRFRDLPESRRQIVFYSEGPSYWKYLSAVIDALVELHSVTVAYLTSDPTDPILENKDSRIDAFYIGTGSVRTFVFQTLRAGVLVMTMPDLGAFHIKRSLIHPVHYVYLHHSIVSTHMIYREGAFDHFDSMLCCGPHHVQEVRAWEKVNDLPTKRLFEHGYAPTDALMAFAHGALPRQPAAGGALNVLLAPSWGPDGILERGAEPLVGGLLEAGHQVAVRPHPRTAQLSPGVLNTLSKRFRSNPRFTLAINTTNLQALCDADIMISDWSGVAMEFSFGLARPVLFVDVPRKVNNRRWQEIGVAPFEEFYRKDVGLILDKSKLDNAPAMIESLRESADAFARRSKALSRQYVFNLGASGRRGADIIAGLAAERQFHDQASTLV